MEVDKIWISYVVVVLTWLCTLLMSNSTGKEPLPPLNINYINKRYETLVWMRGSSLPLFNCAHFCLEQSFMKQIWFLWNCRDIFFQELQNESNLLILTRLLCFSDQGTEKSIIHYPYISHVFTCEINYILSHTLKPVNLMTSNFLRSPFLY